MSIIEIIIAAPSGRRCPALFQEAPIRPRDASSDGTT
jgi:hypothetical protein